MIEQSDLIRIYASAGKVFAVTRQGGIYFTSQVIGTTTYVSRRYVSKIKKILGVRGEYDEKEALRKFCS